MKPQITLAPFLLWSAVAPVWIYLAIVVGFSPGWGGSGAGYVLAPLVLAGITAATGYPFREFRYAWPIAALVAPLLVFFALLAVALLSG
jgi:hypothetical protein